MTGKPRVFVVQQPSRLITQSDGAKRWEPTLDLSAAAAFGPLIQILRPGNIFRQELEHAQAVIAHRLERHKLNADDFVLPVGDPVAIALTIMHASAMTGGRVNVLKYMPRTRHYSPYSLSLEGSPFYVRNDE